MFPYEEIAIAEGSSALQEFGPCARLTVFLRVSCSWSPCSRYKPWRGTLDFGGSIARSFLRMRWLLPFLMLKGRSNRARGEFLVFAFGLTEYRDVRVSIFPGDEEIVVGFQALLTLPLHGIGPPETEFR